MNADLALPCMPGYFWQTGGGCRKTNSMFAPASPGAESIRDISVLVLVITGFIFILVEGILLYAILRFRGGTASGKEPPQVYGSKPIEIAWTAAPALIVFVLALVTTRTLWEVNPTPPQPRPGDHALFVTVVGHQWWWEYRYDHYDGKELGFTTANELHIPASTKDVPRPVYLALESADVCHSFWVPRLAGKTDLISGPHQSYVVPGRPAGVVPRPVCRVLRHAARQHADPRDRRACRGIRSLAGQRGARPGPRTRAIRRRSKTVGRFSSGSRA